jgi:hypothetical protein
MQVRRDVIMWKLWKKSEAPPLKAVNSDGAQELIEFGMVMAQAGQQSSAISLYYQALDLDPNNAIAQYLLGVSLLAKRRTEEGRKALFMATRSPQHGFKADWARTKATMLLNSKSQTVDVRSLTNMPSY